MFRAVFGVLVLVTACAVSGCEDTPTAPDNPTTEVPVVTEAFGGTVTVNGAITHAFVVGTPSSIQATLTTLSTGTETPVGFSLGTWNTTTLTCTVVISNDSAVQGSVIIGSATTAGAFCVRVYDVGRLNAPATYDVTLSHQ